MPDDPVRVALRAAARCLCDVEGPVPCEPPCGGCVHMAAAAVAAFLRALPPDTTITRPRIGYSINDFANMVEQRAAKEAG